MTAQEFIDAAEADYQSISLFDKLRAIYVFKLIKIFAFIIVGGSVFLTLARRGMSGGLVLTGLLIVFVLAVFVAIGQVKKHEKRTPSRRKAFAARIAQFIKHLSPTVEAVSRQKERFSVTLVDGRTLELFYDKDISLMYHWIMGIPFIVDKTHPRLYALHIKGNTTVFADRDNLNFDFSARKDDEDRLHGFGVYAFEYRPSALNFLFRPEIVEIASSTGEVAAFQERLSEAIKGTNLKGRLAFQGGAFHLVIFDDIDGINIWDGTISFKPYRVNTLLKQASVPREQRFCYGIGKLLQLL